MGRLAVADYLDVLVLAEPLACVMHAYKRLPASFAARTVTVFGAGPIGALHVIRARERFPFARVQIVEPDASRRRLISHLFPFAAVQPDVEGLRPSDLAVVATSDPAASVAAIVTTAPAGAVILFSGIDHTSPAELPHHEGHDLEAIHRNEEVRTLANSVRLIGSSGYHRHEIDEAVEVLTNDPAIYRPVQTGVVEGINGTRINGQEMGQPAILALLAERRVHYEHLKVVFRLDQDEDDLRVAVTEGPGRIALQDFRPAGLGPDQVRLKVRRFSVCQTDRRVLQGTKSARLSPGLVLGHEGIGVVEAVGAGLPRGLIGTPCIILPHCFEAGDALDERGVGYLSRQMRHLGIHVDGVFTTRADLPLACVHPIDETVLRLATGHAPPTLAQWPGRRLMSA